MKKIFSISIVTMFILSPFLVYGQNMQQDIINNYFYDGPPTQSISTGPQTSQPTQSISTGPQTIPQAIPVAQTPLRAIPVSQGQAATQGNTAFTGNTNIAGAGGSFGTCLGASGVSNYVKQSIQGLVGSVTEVPTADNSLRGKDTGTLTTAYISWDSMGYCLINSIIESIGAATVQWINSGFQGNPVFVQDPAQFFADIADVEAGNFLNQVSSGFLCEPIRNIVKVNIANQYNNSVTPYNRRGQCTFTGVAGNLEQFMSGETFSWADWSSYTQNPNNNPLGATLYGNIELNRRIANSVGVQSNLLDWGRGFLSFKDPETGKISSPGALIEGQINQRLFNGESRINVADEFDEVVTALVNQLVKVAINEVTSIGNPGSSSGGGNSRPNTPNSTNNPTATSTNNSSTPPINQTNNGATLSITQPIYYAAVEGSQVITWTSTGLSSDEKLNISLSEISVAGTKTTIDSQVSNTGSYTWNVAQRKGQYFLKISTNDNRTSSQIIIRIR